MFTLIISCLTMSNLPCFMDLTLCNIVLYIIELFFHRKTHPQLSIVFALAQSLHSFWAFGNCPSLFSSGFTSASDSKESPCNADSIPGLGKYPEEGNGYLLQYFYIENSTDRGAWLATVHGVTKSQTLVTNTFFLPRYCTGHLPTWGWGWGLILCYHIFLSFHSISGVLQARILECIVISFSSEPCLVKTLLYVLSVLCGSAWHGS